MGFSGVPALSPQSPACSRLRKQVGHQLSLFGGQDLAAAPPRLVPFQSATKPLQASLGRGCELRPVGLD